MDGKRSFSYLTARRFTVFRDCSAGAGREECSAVTVLAPAAEALQKWEAATPFGLPLV
jgi:hypothetical protein